jgi:phage terminase small subunit
MLEDVMAGVKGRSGGARPGAGRKPKVVTRAEQLEQAKAAQAVQTAAELGITDPRDFLLAAMLGRISASPAQMDAAKALVPYYHAKMGEVGKKDHALDNAKVVGGVFQRSAPPQQPLFGKALN